MSVSLDSEPSLTPSAEMARVAPAGLEPGQRDVVASRYRLLQHIAEGGMGSVYVAEHTLSHKRMALKVVHPYLCKGPQGVERFKREVSAAAQIDHPGIVQVFDAGVDDDGGFFMAMELLEGESIGDRLRRDWPGMATAVGWVEGILEPLAKAHAKGFVHRDLKPDNVFLAIDSDGRERVKILDFGLAREVDKGGPTRTGITFGTPEYMSPEQAMSARKVRAPGDVWSVGVMLYELLSGIHPFTGETPNAIMANAIKEPLPPLRDAAPHVPEPLATVIELALEKEPSDRPQTAGEMLEALRGVTAKLKLAETVPAAPTPPTDWGSESDEPSVSVELADRPRQVDISTHDALAARPSPPQRSWLIAIVATSILFAAVLGFAVNWLWSEDGDTPVAVEPAVADPTPTVATSTPRPAPVEPIAPSVEPQPIEPIEPAEPLAPEPIAPSPVVGSTRTKRQVERGPPPIEEARACLARGDRQCALRALEGRAGTAVEFETLITIYRDTRRVPEALDTAATYVRRWPDRARTPEYRAFLQQHGRPSP